MWSTCARVCCLYKKAFTCTPAEMMMRIWCMLYTCALLCLCVSVSVCVCVCVCVCVWLSCFHAYVRIHKYARAYTLSPPPNHSRALARSLPAQTDVRQLWMYAKRIWRHELLVRYSCLHTYIPTCVTNCSRGTGSSCAFWCRNS